MMDFASNDAVFCCNRVTIYPDGSRLIMVADRPIFRRPGWEQIGGRAPAYDYDLIDDIDLLRRFRVGGADAVRDAIAEATQSYEARKQASDARSMRRAKNMIRDYGLCNDFAYFVTLTLSPDKIDRYSIVEATKKLNIWANNQVTRKGLKYILVPERHKDGAIHYHGFFNDALPAVDSGTLTHSGHVKPRRPRSAAERERMLNEGWSIVYNLPNWSLGFSTAIALYGERRAAVAYVCKYINKAAENDGKIGGRWYYSGGGLVKPDVSYGNAIPYYQATSAPGGHVVDVPALGAKICILQIDSG
jgi:hypothetical protein